MFVPVAKIYVTYLPVCAEVILGAGFPSWASFGSRSVIRGLHTTVDTAYSGPPVPAVPPSAVTCCG